MINLIAAIDKNNGIGKNNQLLCYIKDDLEYFKKTTKGCAVIMGYNTWISLPNKPLKGRTNIILTSKQIEIEGAIVIHSIDEILALKTKYPKIFIIGGASLYKQMIQHADKLYITHIMKNFDADTFFPELKKDWKMKVAYCKKEYLVHKYPHIFCIYEKKNNKK